MTKKPTKTKSTKKLFIVESPNKVSTIKKYLGPDFEVIASVGHTYHLPTKNYCNFSDGFTLNYEPDPKKKEVLKNIVNLAEDCGEIMIGTDYDIEGACISWHLYQHLYKKYKNTKIYTRVNLKEITKSGVDQAIKDSYPITDPKEFAIVQAGFLRRIEDRLVGFKISPLANIYVQEKTSAGRVQSPALRILVEREKEIRSFIPQVYFDIFAKIFPKNTTDVFTAKYGQEVTDQKTADLIVNQCKGQQPKVSKVTKKQTKSSPSAPFITKTLLQAGSTVLNWKAQKVTQVAQQLFSTGYITYPRCDNTIISQEAQKMLRDYTKKNFTAQYIPAKLADYNNTKAKLEHECIRPTDLDRKVMLPGDETKLYELIKARFIAAGLTPATYDSVAVDIMIGKHAFKAQGSTQTFDGYKKIWNYTTSTDTTLPSLDEKTIIQLRDTYNEKKETKPPARYKGASLIEALDKMGIGKPSTMNTILETLEKREYIQYDKQVIIPTELGIRLNDFLCKYFLSVIDFDFTAKVEEDQDKVMLGQLKYEQAVSDFYTKLKDQVKDGTIKISSDKKEQEATAIICPSCNTNLLMRKLNKKDNKLFYSCSGYMDKSCMFTSSIGEDGQPVKEAPKYEKLADCPREGCGGILTKRTNKKTGEVFYACSNWKEADGSCKMTADANGEIRKPKEVKKHGKCSKCKRGDMVERKSRTGTAFIACNRYPKCKNTESLDK